MTALLSIERLSRSYAGRVVLRDVTFSAGRAQVVGLIGPNGAGKTTMLRVIAGLQKADSGEVYVGGRRMPDALESSRVAYFGGERTLPPGVRARRWLHLFPGSPAENRNDRIGVLSRGTRQVLGLRAVFSGVAAELMLLDEPWEGLDPDAARRLSGAIASARDRNTTVIASSHRLHDLAGVCDLFVFLDRGTATIVGALDLGGDGRPTGDRLMAAFDAVRRKG